MMCVELQVAELGVQGIVVSASFPSLHQLLNTNVPRSWEKVKSQKTGAQECWTWTRNTHVYSDRNVKYIFKISSNRNCEYISSSIRKNVLICQQIYQNVILNLKNSQHRRIIDCIITVTNSIAGKTSAKYKTCCFWRDGVGFDWEEFQKNFLEWS
jgi:hypothetical protein